MALVTLPESDLSMRTFEPLIVGDVLVDLDDELAYRAGRPLDLTGCQFELLACLAARPGRVFSRSQLEYAIWGYEFEGTSERLRQHVYGLREALGEPCPLRRVYNVGLAIGSPPLPR